MHPASTFYPLKLQVERFDKIHNTAKAPPPWKPSNISGEKGPLTLRIYLLRS